MRWQSIGEIAIASKNKVAVNPTIDYPLIGIRLWGQGCYAREAVSGFDTQYKYFSVANTGNLVLNKIWARNGAISVINEDLAGYYISPEFPVYELDKNQVFPKWLWYYTNHHQLWNDCDLSSRGTSGKNRIKPSQFEKIKIPLPPLPEQKRIVKKLDGIQQKVNKIMRLRAEQEKELQNMLYSRFVEATEGAVMKPMAEVAPIVRRPVKVELTGEYPELGIRNFGKGTFHKPSLKGIEVGTKKLFTIKEKDLLFSNVFAWEGGIAVVKPEDDNRVGSHRFISCVCDESNALPEFLWYYFLSEEGMEKIRLASPGGAGRNRTLGLKKLEKIEVPVPVIDTQREFVQLKRQVDHTLTSQQAATDDLNELMPGLLYKAFKGEL